MMLNATTWLEMVFVRLLYCKVTLFFPFFFSYLTLRKIICLCDIYLFKITFKVCVLFTIQKSCNYSALLLLHFGWQRLSLRYNGRL